MDLFDTATSFIGRGVIELLRALADGVELGLDVVCPVVTPPQLDEIVPRASAASASAEKDPAGVESPTAPAGQPTLTRYDFRDLLVLVNQRNQEFPHTGWDELADKLIQAARLAMK